jgi:uncharacterized protein with HEPN domain
MRDKAVLLKEILSAIDKIDMFTHEMTYEEFISDEKTEHAVIFNLLIIGEAVKNLPADVIQSNPDIPWRQIAGMRDKLTHAYFSIDNDLVWKTIKKVLPGFQGRIREILTKI